MKLFFSLLTCIPLLLSGEDVVRLGNLKFAHYGAVSYMKEIAPKYNLKIEEHFFARGLDAMPAIIAGSIDISASALEAAIAGRAGGVPIYVVAGFAKGGARLLIRPDLNIKTVAELKGKKVGVTRGAVQELLLVAELSKHNLTWSEKPGRDVQIFYLAFADLNQALLSKNVDAICQSEPQASQALSKGYAKELLKPYDTPLGEPSRALVMTEKMYKDKPDVAERILKCFVEATKTFIDNPAVAEKYVRESMFQGQVSAQDYRDAIGNSPFTYDITVDQVAITIDYMQRYDVGRMSKPPIAKDFVKLDLLEKAKKAILK